MSYCRMENTSADLKDCYRNWNDAESESELNHRDKILKTCEDIAMNYGDKFDILADQNKALKEENKNLSDAAIIDMAFNPLAEENKALKQDNEMLYNALKEVIADLFYQVESKHGAKAANKHPSVILAKEAITKHEKQ